MIAIPAGDAVEGFGGRVDGRDAAGDFGEHAFEVFDLAEVADFDVVVLEEDILRLDVQVHEAVLDVHEVEHFRRLGHVREQFFARDAELPFQTILAETLPEVAIGEFHHDQEPTFDDVVAI